MSTAELDLQKHIEEVNRQILSYYTTLDNRGNFAHPPKDEFELHEFINLGYKCNIPQKQITSGHKAPFDFISDIYFQRVKNALGFANRNGGKTYNTAILNHLDMTFKPGCEIASAGAVRDQADKCYRYLCDFLHFPWFQDLNARYKDVTGKPLLDASIKMRTSFNNGALLEIITASEKGLRSPHPHKARIDEIDLIDWDVLNVGLSMARSDDRIRGQNVFTSTRQYQDGSMQVLLDTASERGIHIYEWNIWESLSKCSRRCFDDEQHGTCPIYSFCKGKAHDCEGFYLIDDFIDKVRIIDRNKFEIEWLNSKPSRDKMVYHMFSPNRHIMTPEKLKQYCGYSEPQPSWFRVAGLDFGSSPGHPFVYLKLVEIPGKGAWMVFYEYIAEQRLIKDHATSIKASPLFLGGERIYADWDAQDRMELKAEGLVTSRAVKDVNMGCDYVASLLRGIPKVMSGPNEEIYDEPKLYVWHECPYTIREFGRYHWPTRFDGKPDKSGVPAKEDDHAMDALRYALFSYKRTGGSKYRVRSIPGL